MPKYNLFNRSKEEGAEDKLKIFLLQGEIGRSISHCEMKSEQLEDAPVSPKVSEYSFDDMRREFV
jgi:hypothetical protein